MIKKFNNINYLYSPEHRYLHYFFYSDYVFQINNLKIVGDLKSISNKNCKIIIDQNYLDEFVNYKFLNYEKECSIILFNDGIDYEIHQNNLEKLKYKFKKVNIYSLSNFYLEKNNMISLNNFTIKNKRSLNKIQGVNFIKKLKYYHPLFYSIYNFFRYYKYSKNIINKKKLVFVGKADYKSLLAILEKKFPSNKEVIKYFSNITNDTNNLDNLDLIFDLFNQSEFMSTKFHFKYHLVNMIIRTILVNHLKKFKYFYHKMNTKIPLDLLHSNIYPKLIMLDFGCKVGNSDIYSRSLFINRFYRKSNIKINFFLNDTNYNDENFLEKRIVTLKKSLNFILSFKDFNCPVENLKNKLLKMNDLLKE